jgi:hypothetical protein
MAIPNKLTIDGSGKVKLVLDVNSILGQTRRDAD